MPSRYLAVRAACALMFAIIAVASCSGSTSGVSCASIDPCPKDPPPSQHDISDCEDFLKNCPEYEAYIKCVTANTQCTSAGTTNYFSVSSRFSGSVILTCAPGRGRGLRSTA